MRHSAAQVLRAPPGLAVRPPPPAADVLPPSLPIPSFCPSDLFLASAVPPTRPMATPPLDVFSLLSACSYLAKAHCPPPLPLAGSTAPQLPLSVPVRIASAAASLRRLTAGGAATVTDECAAEGAAEGGEHSPCRRRAAEGGAHSPCRSGDSADASVLGSSTGSSGGSVSTRRKRDRRIQNKLSAKKSRLRKKLYVSALESELSGLREELKRLRLENADLRSLAGARPAHVTDTTTTPAAAAAAAAACAAADRIRPKEEATCPSGAAAGGVADAAAGRVCGARSSRLAEDGGRDLRAHIYRLMECDAAEQQKLRSAVDAYIDQVGLTGQHKQGALRFHLQCLEQILKPTFQTMATMWLLSQRPATNSVCSTLFASLLKECRVTDDQLRAWKGARPPQRRSPPPPARGADGSGDVFPQLQAVISELCDNLACQLQHARQVFSPWQQAQFLRWIETHADVLCAALTQEKDMEQS